MQNLCVTKSSARPAAPRERARHIPAAVLSFSPAALFSSVCPHAHVVALRLLYVVLVVECTHTQRTARLNSTPPAGLSFPSHAHPHPRPSRSDPPRAHRSLNADLGTLRHPPMREVISLHIGGAGVRLGASCWELYCLEHGIALDGSLPVPPDDSHAFNTFFDEREEGDRWTPRAILIDNQADAIEQLRAGELRQLFDPQLIVSGSCGSGSTSRSNAEASPSSFVSAHGRALVDASLDRIRQLAEDCTGLQGFLLFHSAGGGAGSGLSSLLLESLADEFDAKTRISFPIYSKQEQDHPISAPDAYNPVLAGHAMLEHADVTVPFDNSTLHRICKTTLDLQSPTPKDYNSLLAPVLSTLTSSLRYSGLLHSDLEQIVRNLVTRPRFSTIIASYSGFHSAERVLYNTPSILDLTEDCFASRGALVECDLGAPSVRHLAHPCLMHRGDVVPKDVNNAVRAVKGKGGLKFVDWTPEGFKPSETIAHTRTSKPDTETAVSHQFVLCLCVVCFPAVSVSPLRLMFRGPEDD